MTDNSYMLTETYKEHYRNPKKVIAGELEYSTLGIGIYDLLEISQQAFLVLSGSYLFNMFVLFCNENMMLKCHV